MNNHDTKLVTAKINRLRNKWYHLQNEKYNTDLIDVYIAVKDILETIKSIINMKTKKKGGCRK